MYKIRCCNEIAKKKYLTYYIRILNGFLLQQCFCQRKQHLIPLLKSKPNAETTMYIITFSDKTVTISRTIFHRYLYQRFSGCVRNVV